MNEHLAKPIDKNELDNVIKKYFDCKMKKDSTVKSNLSQIVDINIDGIDLNALRDKLNDSDPLNIYTMYDSFKYRFKDFSNKIDTLQTNSKEFKEYIHSLKGVSGNLYINNIYELCKEIEQQDDPYEKLEQLKSKMDKLLIDINEKISPKIKLDQKTLNKDEINEELDKMINAFDEYLLVTTKSFNQFIVSLSQFVSEDKIDILNNYFNTNDSDQLLEELKQIKEQING